MSVGSYVKWAHCDLPDIGVIRNVQGVHVLVQWQGQSQPRWTVDWQIKPVTASQAMNERN